MLLHFVVKCGGCVFPHQVDETSLGKLPRIHHIYIKIIDIIIRIVGDCGDVFKASVVFEIKEFIVFYFAPIVPDPESQAHFISKIVFNIKNVLYGISMSQTKNAAVIFDSCKTNVPVYKS